MFEIRRSTDRGLIENQWHRSFHTFAYAEYFEPQNIEFGPLRALVQERVKPGKGIGPHSHQDVEILAYVMSGEIESKTSLDETRTLRAGDVQLLSAGTGVQHSLFNRSETQDAHILQLWLSPRQMGSAPSVKLQHFEDAQKKRALRLIASPTGELGSLKIQHDARIYATLPEDAVRLPFAIGKGRCAYVHVARGGVVVDTTRLYAGDALKITDTPKVMLRDGGGAEVIVLNLTAARLHAVFQRPRDKRKSALHGLKTRKARLAAQATDVSDATEPAPAKPRTRAKSRSAAAKAAGKGVRASSPASSARSGRRVKPRKATSGR